jgi:hypothetical protein
MPTAGTYRTNCRPYKGIVSLGIDTTHTYFYGDDGALLGTSSAGLVPDPGCVSYHPSFTLPPAPACAPTASLCPGDAGVGDGGASDASTQDATSMLCDCASEEVSLECVCAQGQMACRTFEQATTNVFCQAGFPGRNSVQRGCGYTRVNLGGGLGFQNYVYQGTDHTLVGAWIVNDLPSGTCARGDYRTQMPDLEACPDYAICDLCPGGQNPCQL